MKIIILGNQAKALANFWSVLAAEITAAGHELVFLLPHAESDDDEKWEGRLKDKGARLEHYRLDRKGINPFKDLWTLHDLFYFFRREKPDLLFASTIKPVIYGAFASFLARNPEKSKRFLMITGLGYMFEADSSFKKLLRKIASLMYCLAFSCSAKVYFQNPDDQKLFEELKIIPKGMKLGMTPGTGVDLVRFAHCSIDIKPQGEKLKFLMVARLLEAKGIKEYCLAAEKLKRKYPDLRFSILGGEEKGRGSFPLADLKEWQEEGIVEYLGETKDVRPYLKTADIVVLPSWREGVPTSLLEAMGIGRMLIATDVPGCREVVKEGKNGYLVPVRDFESLAQAMEKAVLAPEDVVSMGLESRKLAENDFSALKVAHGLMKDFGL